MSSSKAVSASYVTGRFVWWNLVESPRPYANRAWESKAAGGDRIDGRDVRSLPTAAPLSTYALESAHVTKLSLLESHDYRGHWWLPGSPHDGVDGTLKYDPQSGMILHLDGYVEEHGYASARGPQLIHGVGLDARPVTLHRTRHRGRSSSYTTTAGMHQDQYWIGTAYFGLHAETEEDLKVRSATFSLAGLREWLNKPSFSLEPMLSAPEFTVKAHDEKLLDVELAVYGGARASVSNFAERHESVGRHLEVRSAPYCCVTFNEPRPFLDFGRFAVTFRMLFSLMEQRADSIEWAAVSQTPDLSKSYDVLFDGVASPRSAEKPSFRMFLPFSRISPELATLVERWYSSEAEFGTLRYEYFRTQLSAMPASPEEDILGLTQLLEGFHRRTSTETRLALEVFESESRAVLDSLPRETAPNISKRVEEWLEHANELALWKRLTRLLKALDPSICTRIVSDAPKFVREVTDARNTLTHNLRPDTDLATTLKDPRGTAIRLRALLLVHLFLSCGIRPETVAEGLKDETVFQALPGGYRREIL
jgi:hypothetical protein